MKYKILLTTIALGAIIACSSATEATKSFLVTPNDEQKMGDDFDKALREKDGSKFLSHDTPTWKYVDSLKQQLVSKMTAEDVSGVLSSGKTKETFFSVEVIDDPTINAFAVPGGYFYIYTGILKAFTNEAELLGVMGHEIGHILKHHSRDRMISAAGGQAALSAIFGDDKSNTAAAANLLTAYVLKEYGKDDELESDSIGIELSYKTGIAPTGIVSFFGRDLNIAADGTCKDGTLDNIQAIFSTHPSNCDRVTAGNRIMATLSGAKDLPDNKAKYEAFKTTLK